jgi:K+/H+ antiporter YhaU regulatory subunit KhtT
MNEFEMYLINKYSYKISRINAKNRTLKDELYIVDDKIKKQSENFIEAYNNSLDLSTKYMCRKEMPKKKIDDEDYLAYFLNDDGENDYGMKIASIYQNFISFQNEFLDNIYKAIKFSGKNYYYTKNITKEILAQNATKNEVVSLNIETDTYSSFYEIYSNYSNRDIFELNENEYKINYKNYRNINYDLNSIENVLADILLTGKKKFVADEQIFVTYENEGYHGKKSSIILNIIQKYPQKPLNEQKREILINNTKKYDNNIKEILNSFQLFMYTLIQLNLPPNKKIIFDEKFFSEKIPKYIEINPLCKELLIKNDIQIENLIDVYEFVEQKSFKDIIKNIDALYKVEVEDKMKEEIKKYFNNIKEKKNELNKIIDKTILTNVVRQFISRFLCENRADASMNEKNSLFDYLPYKEELWIKYYIDENTNEKIVDEIEEMKNLFNIKIENSLDFYNYLFKIRDEKKYNEIKVEVKNKKKYKQDF